MVISLFEEGPAGALTERSPGRGLGCYFVLRTNMDVPLSARCAMARRIGR